MVEIPVNINNFGEIKDIMKQHGYDLGSLRKANIKRTYEEDPLLPGNVYTVKLPNGHNAEKTIEAIMFKGRLGDAGLIGSLVGNDPVDFSIKTSDEELVKILEQYGVKKGVTVLLRETPKVFRDFYDSIVIAAVANEEKSTQKTDSFDPFIDDQFHSKSLDC